MIVVDTSVWVEFFRDSSTPQVEVLFELIEQDAGIALTDVILTELLQGAATDLDARRVERALNAFDVLRLGDLEDFRRAASLYSTARAAGLTIRRTLDCLIASVCVRERLPILHADRDFDRLASCTDLLVFE